MGRVTFHAAIRVAVLDCGVYESAAGTWGPGHTDLNGKVVGRANFTVAPDFDDYCNHGTHVAGIAAAATSNGIGVAGTGYNVQLLNVKVLDDSGSGSTAWVVSGIQWAISNGAKVINMSLGSSGSCPAEMQAAIDAAWAANVVVVASSGNSSALGAGTPANCNHVLAVAATTSTDALASFSNFGSIVDIAAPGVGIYSTEFTGNYAYKNGTSMAAPFVSGVAALVWTLPGVTTAQQVFDRITTNADVTTGTGTL
ncbi:MAG TPA: S8 family serine peptidase [Chloroflexota bacterium]|nr:S8 family serine peptidase [Chloroflexota bacterium]